jgi:hypothetical protein
MYVVTAFPGLFDTDNGEVLKSIFSFEVPGLPLETVVPNPK